MTTTSETVHGLLTPDNCTVIFIDHQPQMAFGIASIDRQLLINNTVGLAKAAKIFKVPVILTTVETKAFSGYMWPQLLEVFPDKEPIERSSMNAWEEKKFVAEVQRIGARNSSSPPSGRRSASASRQSRRSKQATRSTPWKTPLAASARSPTATPCSA